jgi:hypothetical protein
MAKVPPKSVYKSPKSVARNQPVTISADDPNARWDKIGQFKARVGAEVDVVGLDGKRLIDGGKSLTASFSSTGTHKVVEPERFVSPGVGGGEASIQVGLRAIVPTDISNVETSWSDAGSGPNLIVTFNWDYDDPENKNVTEFILEVTADGVTRQTPYGSFPVNKTQASQTATITESIMSTTMGTLTKNVTKVCVYAIDAFYNKSNSVCDNTVPVHILDLPVPVITVSQAVDGYNVAYTIPTQSGFDAIDIVEYESNASTEPTSVTYSRVYFSGISPANILTLNLNSRWVKARFSSRWGKYTAFSAAQKVTPLSPVTIDNVGPSDVTSVSLKGSGIDTSGYLGFNAYADIEWPAVSDTTLRGYRVRFSNDNGTTFSYADSPGTGTVYRLGGLAINSTYKVAVATYDELNNTSSNYISLSPDLTVTGTPSISNYITAGNAGFQFGTGIKDKTGVINSAAQGLYLNNNNYWYLTSSSSSQFKVGGPIDNYISWDGNTFTVDGNLTARGGYFAGNVGVISGGSVYSGNLVSGSISGAGYILNSGGLIFNSPTVNAITRIDSDTGRLTTKEANIGGWIVNDNSISKTQFIGNVAQGTISLNSTAGYISVSNDNVSGRTAGINSSSSATDLAFWSGGTGPANASSNSFRVQLNGDLFASNATITGIVKAREGGFGTVTGDTITKGWEIDANGIMAKGSALIDMGATGALGLGDFALFASGTVLQLTESGSTRKILETDNASANGRIFLGYEDGLTSRQVQVRKSAQVAGDPNGAGAINSGGLRNMFTVSEGQFIEANKNNYYTSAENGSVLLVWDQDDV